MKTINVEEIYNKRLNILKDKFKPFTNIEEPLLTILKTNDNKASSVYVNAKLNLAKELGIKAICHDIMIEDCTEAEYYDFVKAFHQTSEHFILQLPISSKFSVSEALKDIEPHKDLDGLQTNYHTPCTPKGIINLLDEINYDLQGKNVLIIGRSNLVGKPLLNLFLDRNATPTIMHSKSKPLTSYDNFDLIVLATGQKGILKTSQLSTTKEQLIIDVGINRDNNNKLCGDLEIDIEPNDNITITPVPKGIGLMTRLTLFENLYESLTKEK